MPPWVFNSDRTLTTKFSGNGKFLDSLQTVALAQEKRGRVTVDVLYRLLQRSIQNRDSQTGQDVICLIRNCGLQSDSFLGSHVIRMLALFGKLQEANLTFSRLFEPTIYAWSAIIFANAVLGYHQRAFILYQNMNQRGFRPDGHTFVAILKACVTEYDLNLGPQMNTFVGSCLIDMYVRCGHLHDARNVFDVLCKQDATVWNAMIAGYIHYSQTHSALQLYAQMLQEGVELNQITLSCVSKACSDARTLNEDVEILKMQGKLSIGYTRGML